MAGWVTQGGAGATEKSAAHGGYSQLFYIGGRVLNDPMRYTLLLKEKGRG